jgi:hypothetical protein
VTSPEALPTKSLDAIERTRVRVLEAIRHGATLPFDLDSWEAMQVEIAAREPDNPLAHETFGALILTVLFENVNRKRRDRFDFGTIWALVPNAEQLIEHLQIRTADSIKRNDIEAARSVHRTMSRLHFALSALRQNDLVPGKYRPVPVKSRFGFFGPLTDETKRRAPVFLISSEAGPARSLGAYALALILLVTVVVGLFGRRREPVDPASLPKVNSVSFEPVPHEAFGADDLPVVAAARSPRGLQLVVDKAWLSRSGDDRAAALEHLAARLKDLKVERCDVVSTAGQRLASCEEGVCRLATAP